MKVVGVFANLRLVSRDSVAFHTLQYVRALDRSGVDWSVILFEDGDSRAFVGLPGQLTVLNAKRSYAALAFRTAVAAVAWVLLRRAVGIVKTVQAELDRFCPDVLLVDGLPLAPLLATLPRDMVVFTTVDAMSMRHYRLMRSARPWLAKLSHALRAVACECIERLFLDRCAAVHVVSEVDGAYLRAKCPSARIVVIPIIKPPSAVIRPSSDTLSRIVIWGDVGVPHIRQGVTTFLRDVLPQVRSGVRFVVLGRRKPDSRLSHSLEAVGIEAVEWTEDLDTWLAQAEAVVLMDHAGSGIKNRAVHAMAAGALVIATPEAVEGIPVKDGQHAFVRKNPRELALAIDLARHRDGQREMRSRAKELVTGLYSEDRIAKSWLALFRDAANRRTEASATREVLDTPTRQSDARRT